MKGIIKHINTNENYGYIAVKGQKDVYFRMQEGEEYKIGDCVTFDTKETEKHKKYAINMVIAEEDTEANQAEIEKYENKYGWSLKDSFFLNEIVRACENASHLISAATGEKSTLIPSYDYCSALTDGKEDDGWIYGRPDALWKKGDSLLQMKIRNQKRYKGTLRGDSISGTDENAPNYGCCSMLLSKKMYELACEYVEKAGVNPKFYYFVFVEGEKLVSMISLAHVQNLVNHGYNNYQKLGEYPSVREELSARYMIPVRQMDGYRLPKENNE